MIKLDKIYTGGGDSGETSLAGGSRVQKDDIRIDAIGRVDEANAAIGLARAHILGHDGDRLAGIQNALFDLGADIARPAGPDEEAAARITAAHITALESLIDGITEHLAPLTSFVLPGGTEAAARLHVARVSVRAAERAVVTLARDAAINPHTLTYLNRLSDLLFVMARASNNSGRGDILWQEGKSVD